ncbi:MAG TPA: holo-ACP synthase [Streptomyces sp.]
MRIGVDLQSVSRFARIAAHRRYRGFLFTEQELDQAEGLSPERYAERLAGRFCAKEATCKVLGRGYGQGLRWRDIEVVNDAWGAPSVHLTGGARRLADQAGLSDFRLTLTHQADLVVAVAMAEETPPAAGPRTLSDD